MTAGISARTPQQALAALLDLHQPKRLLLLALLVSPVALAQSVSVETNSLMRLPSSTSVLQLERLDVADYGTLLIPATISQVTVDELHLGREARIAIAPATPGCNCKCAVRNWTTAARSLHAGHPVPMKNLPRPGAT